MINSQFMYVSLETDYFGIPFISLFSSRPHTAATQEQDDLLGSAKMMTQSPINAKEIIRRVRQLEVEEEASDIVRLIYHETDFGISHIVDNPKVCRAFLIKIKVRMVVYQLGSQE